MSFLDQLAFGPGGGKKAWARGLMIALAALAVVAGLLYYTVSGDYAFLRASDPDRIADRRLSRAGRAARGARAQEERPSEGRRHRGVGRKHHAPGWRKRALRSRLRVRAGWIADAGGRGARDAWTAAAAGIAIPVCAARPRDQDLQRPQRAIRSGSVPEGSGTAYLMQQLLLNSDLSGLGLKSSNHDLEAQAAACSRRPSSTSPPSS